MIDNNRFEEVKRKIIGVERLRPTIGTLSEKTMHIILKNYYEPDEDKQEIPIDNYVADIYANDEIIEIQTRQFNRMRDKLTAFLPQFPVTIVYPIPRIKWLIWIDEETGELSQKRKSPVKGNAYMAFDELYKIKMFLKDSNIRIKLVLVDIEEYKLLNGWSADKKKGSTRYDRIPLELVEEIDITCPKDYVQFIPYDLQEPFTVKQYAKAVHISAHKAQTVINVLKYVEAIEFVGKAGREYLYKVK